ncbi:MAG: vitamin K epoxide reductase family protein [Anaerolineae bacterium]|nr:vitamin K epoxide reductase family protein [Anaerolineae bacterium]
MKHKVLVLLGVLAAMAALIWAGAPNAAAQSAPKPVVRAILFHAEGCSHCRTVIDKVLPPLQLKHGDQLQIAMIEVSGKESYDYFRQIEEAAKLPPERKGVPALFIADQILVGDQEIPQKLPGLIQKGLASGGIDYPALPGLSDRLPKATGDVGACSVATPCPTPTAQLLALASNQVKAPGGSAPAANAAAANAPAEEPVSNGFGLATAIAVLLALSVVYALVAAVMAGTGRTPPVLPEWTASIIPVLCVIGLGVAGYLTFVETQNVSAVCGPSPYAKLFGFLPVGILGLAGYVAIIAAWAWGRWGKGILALYAPALLLAMALFGVLFSLYLTYIELAVILAVCIWCLTSAVLMAFVLILAVGPAMGVFLGEEAPGDEGEE